MSQSVEHAEQYFRNRAKQMGPQWSILSFMVMVVGGRLSWGLRCTFVHNTPYGNQYYQSVYVFEEYRSKGMMTKYVQSDDSVLPFVTMPDCNISEWFIKHKVTFLTVL